MLRHRNALILAGAALVAFLIFLAFGAEDRGAVSQEGREGRGFLGWFGKSGGASGSGQTFEESGQAGSGGARQGRDAKRKLLQRKSAKKKKGPTDPNLIQKMTAGLGQLIPSSTPDASREGMLTQRFRGAGGAGGTVVRGGAGGTTVDSAGAEDAGEPDSSEPAKCDTPKIRKSVFDLQTHSQMRAAFDVPSKSAFITSGFGERFSVDGGPAYVIYIPRTRRGTAGAIFDNRFLVSISGECIPNRQFLKSLLHQ